MYLSSSVECINDIIWSSLGLNDGDMFYVYETDSKMVQFIKEKLGKYIHYTSIIIMLYCFCKCIISRQASWIYFRSSN